jgi:5-methylcytosine-specific restriction endonuclease McrA
MARPNPYASATYKRNRLIVLNAAGGRCFSPGCQRPALTADHITPLCQGGTHDLANLRACCAYHNSQRSMQLLNQRRTIGRSSRRW